VTTFRGFPSCDCLAEWLPVYERVLILRGVVRERIDIAQLIGGAPQSGGTHTRGGAYDVWQHDLVAIETARQMGAGAWARTEAQGFDPHQHGVLRGCPHNLPARYQLDALAAGFNGLGSGGRGGRDDGPRVGLERTWRDGIAWANQLLQEADDVAWNDELAKWQPGDKDKTDMATAGQQLGQARGYAQAAYQSARRAERAVEALAKALGPEVAKAVQAAMAETVVDVDVTVNGVRK